jgi:MraZ protein
LSGLEKQLDLYPHFLLQWEKVEKSGETGMGGTFHGAAVITLDAKGRIAIPTRHRDALLDGGRSLVLTAHPDGCVLIYPAPAWEPVRAQVETFPSFHPQASWWKRVLLGFEEHVAADGTGRILLPPALRQHAKLEREAMMVGQGRYFELWDSGIWSAKLGQALSGTGVPPPGMEDFSL